MIILEAIKQYINKDETDYAVMIKGDWGSGKTHFWKNEIFHYASEKKMFPLYLSFFGITTIGDILNKIISEIVGRKNTKIKNVIPILSSLIKQKINFDLSVIPNFINFKNYVICVDDIERAKLDMNQIFGFMNYFIEHQNAKVIFLTNEENILSAYSEQKDIDRYHK